MTEDLRVGEYDGWILTQHGQMIHYEKPDYGQITVVDIAHHLGNLCRFTGGTRYFYSVAQHSLFVTFIIERLLRDELTAEEQETAEYYDQLLAGMLHDASEAYINDLASPLKQIIGGRYKWFENGLSKAIFERYGVDFEYMKSAVLKDADNIAMMHERFYLLPEHAEWPVDPKQIQYPAPQYVDPAAAGQLYLKVFTDLMNKRNAARAMARVAP